MDYWYIVQGENLSYVEWIGESVKMSMNYKMNCYPSIKPSINTVI